MSLQEKTNILNQTELLGRYTSPNHWLTTNKLLKELTEIANQPIFASVKDKDILFDLFIKTIYCGYFDELQGGLLIEKNVSLPDSILKKYNKKNNLLYHKPLTINLSLCRLLLAADQVFYHGEFRVIAHKILFNIIYMKEKHTLYNENYSDIKGFYCSFDKRSITSILDKHELALFESLSNGKTIDGQLLYTKTCSLKDAAKNANVEYKESQIIEHSINQKLITYNDKVKVTKLSIKGKSLDQFQINCELIEVISEYLSFSDNANLKEQADNIFTSLDQELRTKDESKTNSFTNSLSLICAGISLLTTSFESLLLSKITALLSDTFFLNNFDTNHYFSNSVDLNVEKINYQKNLVITFITSLPEQFNLPNKLLKIACSELALKYKFNLVFIERYSVDQEQQITNLKSKFNTLQKIFLY